MAKNSTMMLKTKAHAKLMVGMACFSEVVICDDEIFVNPQNH